MDTHQQSLIDTLISQNATLSGRVNQLETENNSLRIHKGGFERYFGEHRRDIYRRNRNALYGVLGENASDDIGDVLNRREAFLRLVSEIPGCNPLLALHPHNGIGNRFRVLLLSAGGMGDGIILTYFAGLIRSYFPVDYLAVGFESNQIKEVFLETGLADAVLVLNHETRDALFSVTTAMDIFDMVIDVRYSAVTFFPPKSRVPLDYQLMTRNFSEPWFKYNLFDWPHLNHHFATAAVKEDLNAYSLFPNSLALGNVTMKPVMDIEPSNSLTASEILESEKPIVCLGIGSDSKMSGENGLSTKTVPIDTINLATDALNKLGYLTVQLGMAHEPKIAGVQVDMRGLLTIRESAAVLMSAVCFVGVEGGLVHMAKAVGTPSVVCFGPTPAAFFGYDENVNISNDVCTPCWWTTREWMTRCISSSKQHGCMKKVDVADLLAGVQKLHEKKPPTIEIVVIKKSEFEAISKKYASMPDLTRIYSDSLKNSGFEKIISSYFSRLEDDTLTILNRTNIPHALSMEGDVFIDGTDMLKMSLQILNMPRIFNDVEPGRLIIGTINLDQSRGLDSTKTELAFHKIKTAFTAKGWEFKVEKPKKLVTESEYYITIKWCFK